MFVQTTVLLTPITTVTTSGEYPGAPLGLAPEPLGMVTATVAWVWALARGRGAASPANRRNRTPTSEALRDTSDSSGHPTIRLCTPLNGREGLIVPGESETCR